MKKDNFLICELSERTIFLD